MVKELVQLFPLWGVSNWYPRHLFVSVHESDEDSWPDGHTLLQRSGSVVRIPTERTFHAFSDHILHLGAESPCILLGVRGSNPRWKSHILLDHILDCSGQVSWPRCASIQQVVRVLKAIQRSLWGKANSEKREPSSAFDVLALKTVGEYLPLLRPFGL